MPSTTRTSAHSHLFENVHTQIVLSEHARSNVPPQANARAFSLENVRARTIESAADPVKAPPGGRSLWISIVGFRRTLLLERFDGRNHLL